MIRPDSMFKKGDTALCRGLYHTRLKPVVILARRFDEFRWTWKYWFWMDSARVSRYEESLVPEDYRPEGVIE